MKKTYKVSNVSCEKCVNLIRISLKDNFPDIRVDLNANPKEVTLTINTKEEETLFKTQMNEIGFPILE